MDENIQEKYDNLVSQIEKKYKKELSQKLSEERRKTLEKIIEIKPSLEKDKNQLFESIMGINKTEKKSPDIEIVLEQFTEGDNIYYKDTIGCIWDSHAKPVGSIECYTKEGKPKCIFYKDKQYKNRKVPQLD
jgi:hypothetical protein